MEGSASFHDIVLGQSVMEAKEKVRHFTNTLNAGATGSTVIHEYGHVFLNDAVAAGRITLQEAAEAMRAFDTVQQGKRERRGPAPQGNPQTADRPLSFLREGRLNFTSVSEAVSEFLESEVLRRTKTNGRRGLPPAIISRNTARATKLAPGSVPKFARFLKTVRELFGLVFQRAQATRNTIEEGETDAQADKAAPSQRISRKQLGSFFLAEGDLNGDKLERAIDETTDSLAGNDGTGRPRDGGLGKFLGEFSGFMKRVAEGGPGAPQPGGKAASILLADRLTHQIESWKPVGSIVKGPEDIFALNQAFRNPWFKSIRLMAIHPETGAVISARVHSMGTTSRLSSDLNDIMGFMEEIRGEHPFAELVISTNHPGGDPRPTAQDQDLHAKARKLADELGIPLADYVITNGTRGWSMAQNEEFTMPEQMAVTWAATERSEMTMLQDTHLQRDLAATLRASNPDVNWVVYLDEGYRARAMNVLPDDPEEAAKVILRDTWEQGTKNLVLFPGTANQNSEQWAQPVEDILGTHRTRHPAIAIPGEPDSPSGSNLGEGGARPYLASFPSLAEGQSGEMIHGIDSERISSYLQSRGHEGGQLEQATRRTERLLKIREAGGPLAITDFVSDAGRSVREDERSQSELFPTFVEQALSGDSSSAFPDLEPGGRPVGILLQEMIDRAIPEWNPLGKTVESAEDIFALNAVFRNPWFESVRLMAISPSSGEVIASSIHSVGNIYRTSGEVSDMIGFILAAREIDPEATLVISHNHPGGDPRPSEDDKALQEDLQSFADDLGIPIMDHVITNGTRGWSMKDGWSPKWMSLGAPSSDSICRAPRIIANCGIWAWHYVQRTNR
ncbi:JAB domain-containing protein [Luteolibacter luteus]|uniref:RadC-like JAB domain-containing protein n=1 Tax=Luteolibacter luteus TaxID=2728835 RepID=A0A858RRT6_9BACT|nr:JAB domain-containing protein [Luteolibacter luteus]QJE99138.1 hypothetical protein HHL09_26275 [Luteolibacter luteus]